MSWIVLSLLSALMLGCYDLLKKSAVRENAVLPVLYFSVVTGALIWLPLLIWACFDPSTAPEFARPVMEVSPRQHVSLFIKSCIAASAWITGYFALKHLPISIASPIRATSPVWTILIAVLVLGESPTSNQWIGVLIILGAFYAFSTVGKLEGIHFHRDKWVGLMFVSALLSSASALYDKYLLQAESLPAASVQCWFSMYLVIALTPMFVMWRRGLWTHNPFQWRSSIPMIGVSLLIADYLYFSAVAQEDALISVISPLRRSAILMTFVGGVFFFGEKNWRPKALCIAALLIGIVVLNM